jgi:hypothetical protein
VTKGQSSLEFMMTYGWVMVIIMIVTVVMWQWGMFSFGGKIEPGSFGFWGVVVFGGNDFRLDTDGKLQIALLNMAGANITLLTANVSIGPFQTDCDVASQSCLKEPGGAVSTVIPSGGLRILEFENPNFRENEGKRFDAYVTIQYNDSRTGDMIYQSSGRIWGNVEPQ